MNYDTSIKTFKTKTKKTVVQCLQLQSYCAVATNRIFKWNINVCRVHSHCFHKALEIIIML